MTAPQHTERGFGVYCKITDTRQQCVRVQQSSIATDTCVWIFCKAEDGSGGFIDDGKVYGHSPHLNRAQAIEVANALLAWAKDQEE